MQHKQQLDFLFRGGGGGVVKKKRCVVVGGGGGGEGLLRKQEYWITDSLPVSCKQFYNGTASFKSESKLAS